MAIFTAAEVEEQLQAWKTALLKVSLGQEYAIQGRRLTRADISEIRRTLSFLARERSQIEAEAAGATGGLQNRAFRPVR